MAMLIDRADLPFNLRLKNFVTKAPGYSVLLAILPSEITALKADSVAFDYLLNNQIAVQTFSQTYTGYKNLLRKGGQQSLGPLPLAPVFGAPPPMPAPDVEGRFRTLVQRISHHPAYTTLIGEDLGILAPVVQFNAAQGKPVFTIEPSSGGYPNLRWTKGKYQGIEIWKNTGTGFTKLDRDMRPDYIDKSDLPEQGVSAVWKYKIIYLLNDDVIGNWSDEVSITVYGAV